MLRECCRLGLMMVMMLQCAAAWGGPTRLSDAAPANDPVEQPHPLRDHSRAPGDDAAITTGELRTPLPIHHSPPDTQSVTQAAEPLVDVFDAHLFAAHEGTPLLLEGLRLDLAAAPLADMPAHEIPLADPHPPTVIVPAFSDGVAPALHMLLIFLMGVLLSRFGARRLHLRK